MSTHRNRHAKHRHAGPAELATGAAIVEACVPLWLECAKRANSRYGGEKPGNHKGRDAALYSVDDRLAEHGITWAKDRREYQNYERAVRTTALARDPRRSA